MYSAAEADDPMLIVHDDPATVPRSDCPAIKQALEIAAVGYTHASSEKSFDPKFDVPFASCKKSPEPSK